MLKNSDRDYWHGHDPSVPTRLGNCTGKAGSGGTATTFLGEPVATLSKSPAMNRKPQLLDVVALLSDLPEHGLVRGRVGAVVELLDGVYEVEFSADEGKTYAELALEPSQLLVLHHRPLRAA